MQNSEIQPVVYREAPLGSNLRVFPLTLIISYYAGMVVHACESSTQETEAEGWPNPVPSLQKVHPLILLIKFYVVRNSEHSQRGT